MDEGKIFRTPGIELIGTGGILCDELQEHLDMEDGMLRHPLLVNFYDPNSNAYYNFLLGELKKGLEKAANKGDWRGYVFAHARPYRCSALAEIEAKIPDEAYWPLVRSVWEDSENIFQFRDYWKSFFNSKRPGRENMMVAEERALFASLPERLTIYRGWKGNKRFAKGWSWSLDRAKAEWFSRRFANVYGTPGLSVGTVKKANVVAYLDGREEKEIIADPRRVEVAKE